MRQETIWFACASVVLDLCNSTKQGTLPAVPPGCEVSTHMYICCVWESTFTMSVSVVGVIVSCHILYWFLK